MYISICVSTAFNASTLLCDLLTWSMHVSMCISVCVYVRVSVCVLAHVDIF